MELSTNVLDGCAKITVSGMIATLDSEVFLSELERLPEGVRNIEFDFEHVSYISSSGLRVLLAAISIAEKRGGTIKVIKSSEFVREILSVVGFDKVFEVA
jgi:anti-sigma B factor antagonist